MRRYVAETRGLWLPSQLRDPGRPAVPVEMLFRILRGMQPGESIMIKCIDPATPAAHRGRDGQPFPRVVLEDG